MNKNKKDHADYETIGKIVYSLNDVYSDKKKLYKTAFVKGLFSGLGGVIGATVLVGLLLWTLSLFNEVPFVGRFSRNLKDTVEQTR